MNCRSIRVPIRTLGSSFTRDRQANALEWASHRFFRRITRERMASMLHQTFIVSCTLLVVSTLQAGDVRHVPLDGQPNFRDRITYSPTNIERLK